MSEMDEYNEFSNDGVDDIASKLEKNGSDAGKAKDNFDNAKDLMNRLKNRKNQSDQNNESDTSSDNSQNQPEAANKPSNESSPSEQDSTIDNNTDANRTSDNTPEPKSDNDSPNQNENNSDPTQSSDSDASKNSGIDSENPYQAKGDQPNVTESNKKSGNNPLNNEKANSSDEPEANIEPNDSLNVTDVGNPAESSGATEASTAGGATTGNAMASSAATEGAAAGGTTAGGAAAGGTAAGGTAAGGAAAGGAAAGGATAGGAAAGAAVVAAPEILIVIAAILAVLAVILVFVVLGVVLYTYSPKNISDGTFTKIHDTVEQAEAASNKLLKLNPNLWDYLLGLLWTSNPLPDITPWFSSENYEDMDNFEKFYKQEKVNIQKALLAAYDMAYEEARQHAIDNEKDVAATLSTMPLKITIIFESRKINFGDIMAAAELYSIVHAKEQWDYETDEYVDILTNENFLEGLFDLTYEEKTATLPILGLNDDGESIVIGYQTVDYYDVTLNYFTKDTLYETIGVEPDGTFETPADEYSQTFEDLWQVYLETYKEYCGTVDLHLDVVTPWKSGPPDTKDDREYEESNTAVPRYFQKDYPTTWTPVSGSGGCYIPRSGCFFTCVSMLCSYYSGESITPTVLAQNEKYKQFVDSEGNMAYDGPRIMIGDYGGTVGSYYRSNFDYYKLVDSLENGDLAIVKINANTIYTTRTHYIVITGITQSGDFYVNDPTFSNYTKYGTVYPAENVMLGAVYMYTFNPK